MNTILGRGKHFAREVGRLWPRKRNTAKHKIKVQNQLCKDQTHTGSIQTHFWFGRPSHLPFASNFQKLINSIQIKIWFGRHHGVHESRGEAGVFKNRNVEKKTSPKKFKPKVQNTHKQKFNAISTMMGNVTGGLLSRGQGSQRYVERRGDKSCLEIFEVFFDICLHGGLLRRSLILVWVLLFMMVS